MLRGDEKRASRTGREEEASDAAKESDDATFN